MLPRAVIDAVCSPHPKVSAVGEQMVRQIVDVVVGVTGSVEHPLSSYVLGTMLATAATFCYTRECHAKAGACRVISLLATRMCVPQAQIVARAVLKVGCDNVVFCMLFVTQGMEEVEVREKESGIENCFSKQSK